MPYRDEGINNSDSTQGCMPSPSTVFGALLTTATGVITAAEIHARTIASDIIADPIKLAAFQLGKYIPTGFVDRFIPDADLKIAYVQLGMQVAEKPMIIIASALATFFFGYFTLRPGSER